MPSECSETDECVVQSIEISKMSVFLFSIHTFYWRLIAVHFTAIGTDQMVVFNYHRNCIIAQQLTTALGICEWLTYRLHIVHAWPTSFEASENQKISTGNRMFVMHFATFSIKSTSKSDWNHSLNFNFVATNFGNCFDRQMRQMRKSVQLGKKPR